jgi:hypothetical protein
MIGPGSFAILHLQNPKEKFWGLLVDLNPTGATMLGIDIRSFEDWVRMIMADGRNIGLTAMFVPMWRVERISLDQTVDDLLSLQAQFELRTGIPIRQYLEGQLPHPPEEEAPSDEM